MPFGGPLRRVARANCIAGRSSASRPDWSTISASGTKWTNGDVRSSVANGDRPDMATPLAFLHSQDPWRTHGKPAKGWPQSPVELV
jgi:hypothetical protein